MLVRNGGIGVDLVERLFGIDDLLGQVHVVRYSRRALLVVEITWDADCALLHLQANGIQHPGHVVEFNVSCVGAYPVHLVLRPRRAAGEARNYQREEDEILQHPAGSVPQHARHYNHGFLGTNKLPWQDAIPEALRVFRNRSPGIEAA